MPDRGSGKRGSRAGVQHVSTPARACRENAGAVRLGFVRVGVRAFQWCFGLGVLATASIHLADPAGVGRPICRLVGEFANMPCAPRALGEGLGLLLLGIGVGSLLVPARPALALQSSLLVAALGYHALHEYLVLGSTSCGCATSKLLSGRDEATGATTLVLALATTGIAATWCLVSHGPAAVRWRKILPLFVGALVVTLGLPIASGLSGTHESVLVIEVASESRSLGEPYPRMTIVHATGEERVVDGIHDPQVLAARLAAALHVHADFRVVAQRTAGLYTIQLQRVRWHRASPRPPQISVELRSASLNRLRVAYPLGCQQSH